LKAFGWAADNGGCRWYRLEVPFAELGRRGHVVGHAIKYTAGWDDADVIVAQRVARPGPSVLWQQWAEQGRRLVYDVDDDYFHVDPASRAAREFFGRQGVQRQIATNVEMASAVTVCSPRLAEVMRPYNPHVYVVPNGLPAEILTWQVPRRDDGLVTLGWAGTPSTLPDLAPLAGRLRRFLDRHPGVELHTIGMPAEAIAAAGLRHERVRVTPHVQGTEAYLRTIDFDVWVAPYRPILFNKSKAPTKALEAGALGIPIVASDIEPYRRHVRQGETGRLISRDHEWDQALHELVTDPDLRARMGAAAREQARDHTIEKIAPLWEHALAGS
jgi:glycosyltransferase involved in cell wall biosynthesis